MSANYEAANVNPASTHGDKLAYMMKIRDFHCDTLPVRMNIFVENFYNCVILKRVSHHTDTK